MVDLKLKTQEKYDKDILKAQEKKRVAEAAAAKAEALKEKVDKAIRIAEADGLKASEAQAKKFAEVTKVNEEKISAKITAAQKELEHAYKLMKEAENKRSKIEAETKILMTAAKDQKTKADKDTATAGKMQAKA